MIGNVLYDNTAAAIKFDAGSRTVSAVNNTIIQEANSAIVIGASVTAGDFRNNILQLGRGAGAGTVIGFDVSDAAQAGFTSDFNLFDLGAGGQIARWQGLLFRSLLDWTLEVGFDGSSLIGDPGFVAPAGPDLIRGFVGGTDHGADDDFHLVSNSIAIDHGDPRSSFLAEPQPNGARANIGAFGNSASATTSAAAEAQILESGRPRPRAGRSGDHHFVPDGRSCCGRSGDVH